MGPNALLVPAVNPRHVRRLTACMVPVALLASLALAGRAEAAPVVECGATLTVDTTLTRDLTCTSGDGVILGPNVHLNLGGHKLVGPGSSGTGIASTGQGTLSVRNGEIRNWGTGIHVETDFGDGVPDPSVTDVVLRRAPVLMQFAPALALSRVTAIDSPVRGELGGTLRIAGSKLVRSSVSVFYASASIVRSRLVASTVSSSASGMLTIDRSSLDGRHTARLGDVSETIITITNSVVKNYKDPISGFWGGATLTNNVFTDMHHGVLGNISYGLGSEGTATVTGNVFTRSGVVLDPHIPMILENNRFTDNAAGAVFNVSTIFGDPAPPGRAVNNVLVKNRGTGIQSEIPGLLVGGNVAKKNAGYGIYAPGAIDLGGNVAYGNKLGQCVGVVCSGRK